MPAPLFLKRIGENMEEQIKELDRKLNQIYVEHMVYQKDNIKKVAELMMPIKDFSLWFLQENKFGIDEELYQGMVNNLLEILQDMMEALKYGDRVLLHDATAYGFQEYLDLFLPDRGNK